jgi:(hydroxyamino)benzene mutase
MSQTSFAVGLLKSGSILLTSGFLWGIAIPATPFPRIALSTHMNMLQHGLLSIAGGLILRQSGLVTLNHWQIWTVVVAHYYLWILDFVSVLNAWWGTNKTLSLVCSVL